MTDYLKKYAKLLFVIALGILIAGGAYDVHAQSPANPEGGNEICDNGADTDGDGRFDVGDDDNDKLFDGADPDCYTLLAPLPGLTSINTTQGLPSYLNTIFRLLIGIAGVVAVVRIVMYGIQYMMSDSPFGKTFSKGQIWEIIGGLVLLITSVIILNTINPNLTEVGFDLETVKHPVELETFYSDPAIVPNNTTGSCPYRWTTGHRTGVVEYSSDDPKVQENLNQLKQAVTSLKAKVEQEGGSLTVTSAHRSLAYQKHFYEIKTLNAKLKADDNPDCDGLRGQVAAEIAQHGLNCDGTGGCVVNPPYDPDKCGGNQNQSAAPHVRGTGIDITFTGITRAAADLLAASNNIKIRAQADLAIKDPQHWNLIDPPYTGCASS